VQHALGLGLGRAEGAERELELGVEGKRVRHQQQLGHACGQQASLRNRARCRHERHQPLHLEHLRRRRLGGGSSAQLLKRLATRDAVLQCQL
jgi:hypothetical protein